jgi:beta-N-acetylhexosaminidase
VRPVLAPLLAAAALAVCGCFGSDDGGDAELVARSAGMSNAQLVGQRLVAGFEGERPPRELRRRIRAGRIAGVILFEQNFDSRAEARGLVRKLQSIRRPREVPEPLLVLIDQEGGLVERLDGPPSLSASEMGAAGAGTCRREAGATGRMLARVGVNVDLAPVLDVARAGSAIESEGRSFGRDADEVARCGEAFADGLEDDGVAPTAKHFPGIGAAEINTDDAVQRIEISKSRLRALDEKPYETYLEGGAAERLVMLSSAVYPAFSDEPASMTRKLATVELRERLGFEGVSITDALETASTAAFGGPTAVAADAARAGADLLLFVSFGAAAKAAAPLQRALRADRERFVASVERVLALRESLR